MTVKQKNRKRRAKACKANNLFLRKRIAEQEKEIFDLRQLFEISSSLNSFIEFDRLIEAILYGVMAQLKTLATAIYTKKNTDDDFFVLHRNYFGFVIDHSAVGIIPSDHQIIKFLKEKKSVIEPNEIKSKIKNDNIVDGLISLQSSLFVPLLVKNDLIGFIVLGERITDSSDYDLYEKKLVEDIASLAAVVISKAQLLELTTTDMMTHLKVKHYFYAVLSEHLKNMQQNSNESFLTRESVSVLMIDVDFFKKINDTYGHIAGDFILKEVAKIIKNSTRPFDVVARYGGEEFIVMLSGDTAEQAKSVAERIRTNIEKNKFIYENTEIPVTISIGAAQHKCGQETAKDLVNRADKALYESKKSGRNKTTIAND